MTSPSEVKLPKKASNAVSELQSLEHQFRAGMRQLAGGVCIIATQFDGERHASTVTSVSSLSMDPPSMIVCVNSGSSIHAPLQAAGRLSINLLSASQLHVAQCCTGFDGRTGEARFAAGDWVAHRDGVPVLHDALASIICTIDAAWTGGSHSVMHCMVQEILAGPPGQPLVYANRRYGTLLPLEPEPASQA